MRRSKLLGLQMVIWSFEMFIWLALWIEKYLMSLWNSQTHLKFSGFPHYLGILKKLNLTQLLWENYLKNKRTFLECFPKWNLIAFHFTKNPSKYQSCLQKIPCLALILSIGFLFTAESIFSHIYKHNSFSKIRKCFAWNF